MVAEERCWGTDVEFLLPAKLNVHASRPAAKKNAAKLGNVRGTSSSTFGISSVQDMKPRHLARTPAKGLGSPRSWTCPLISSEPKECALLKALSLLKACFQEFLQALFLECVLSCSKTHLCSAGSSLAADFLRCARACGERS